ncbi:MAG: S41 family peptidase, partial [Campylobacterales bacterium]
MKRGFLAVGLALTLLSGNEVVESRAEQLKALEKFVKVAKIIQSFYIKELNTTAIVNKALKGLLPNLDPHSSFLDKKALQELKISTNGEFGGLGIVVGMKNGVLTVISPIDDTPAYKAGLKPGDIILKIGDKATLDMSLDEAVSLMRGKPGTKVRLTIVRKGQKPLTVTITRAKIHIKSVKTRIVKGYPEIGYIRIASFDKNVVSILKKVLEQYKKEGKKGIVIDLRNDPGGLLSQAVGTLDLFISKGVLVSQKGRIPSENEVYYAHQKGTYKKIPIVILVNGGTASAAEIVSGGLQDYHRAVVVGERTFGKGSVQMVIPIDRDEAVKLTVAQYYLPSGRSIQAEGVKPDIIVYPGTIKEANATDEMIREADLKAHLRATLEELEEK